MEYTKTLDDLIAVLKDITDEDKDLVVALVTPLKTEKMQLEFMDYLRENYKNPKMMTEDKMLEKMLQIVGAI